MTSSPEQVRQMQEVYTMQEIQMSLPALTSAALPPIVHHYTDTAGLLGIIESGVLWGTDYRYVNDTSEIRYIYDLARRVAESYLAKEASGGIRRTFLETAATAERPTAGTPYHLVCFSEADNSLSQWRAYGGRQGFCLDFPGDITSRPEGIGVAKVQGQTPGITLTQVIYDIDVHTEFVTALTTKLMEFAGSEQMSYYVDAPEQGVKRFLTFYFGQLDRASYMFKHPDFADEKEWRLVSWGSTRESFRVGATLTPYIKVRPFSADQPNISGQQLPLLAVGYGPTALPGETAGALDRLLTTHGYAPDYCQRRGSTTPARLL